MWVEITTNGKKKIKSFGPYKLERRPTEADLICVLKSKNEDNTKGKVEVGSNKEFASWKLTYTVNGGTETQITDGETIEIDVKQNDYIEVKYSKSGETDVIKTLKVTELKIGYTLKYNATEGTGAPTNQTQYDNAVFTISNIKPTKEGYNFVGWTINVDNTGTVYNAGGTITINNTENTITLYAKWEEKQEVIIASLTFNNNNELTEGTVATITRNSRKWNNKCSFKSRKLQCI